MLCWTLCTLTDVPFWTQVLWKSHLSMLCFHQLRDDSSQLCHRMSSNHDAPRSPRKHPRLLRRTDHSITLPDLDWNRKDSWTTLLCKMDSLQGIGNRQKFSCSMFTKGWLLSMMIGLWHTVRLETWLPFRMRSCQLWMALILPGPLMPPNASGSSLTTVSNGFSPGIELPENGLPIFGVTFFHRTSLITWGLCASSPVREMPWLSLVSLSTAFRHSRTFSDLQFTWSAICSLWQQPNMISATLVQFGHKTIQDCLSASRWRSPSIHGGLCNALNDGSTRGLAEWVERNHQSHLQVLQVRWLLARPCDQHLEQILPPRKANCHCRDLWFHPGTHSHSFHEGCTGPQSIRSQWHMGRPQDKDGRPETCWKLVWLEGQLDFQSASLMCSKLQDTAGLVRIRSKYAIRTHKSHLDAVWKAVCPSTPPPMQLETSQVWKIESLPYGVTQAKLLEWAQHHSLKIRPMRAMGPRAWLVGAMDSPPDRQLHFNGAPLFIRELRSRVPAQNPLIAGPRPWQAQTDKPATQLTPLPFDPWGGWKPTTAPLPAAPAAAGSIGPTEAKFAEQETRLAKLEDAISKQAATIDTIQQDARQHDQAIRQHLDQRLLDVKTELSDSFSQALQHQSKSFEQNFGELKNLLMQGASKRKASPANDMDQSWLGSGCFATHLDFAWTFCLALFLCLANLFRFLDSLRIGVHSRVLRLVVFMRAIQLACALSTHPHHWSPDTSAGYRFGEALHPGPTRMKDAIRFCVTNPTCVSKKFHVYEELLTKHSCHLVSLSETAATATIQAKLARQLRPLKASALWSPPVQPMCQTISGFEHTRGKAAGVGLFTPLPVRPSRLQIDSDWSLSTRFLHAVVHLGQLPVQVVVLYGKPSSREQAADFNNELMNFAVSQIVRGYHFPTWSWETSISSHTALMLGICSNPEVVALWINSMTGCICIPDASHLQQGFHHR